MAEIEAWLVGMIQTPARKFCRKYRNVFHKKSYFTQFLYDLVFIQDASIQNRPKFYSIAMLSCLVITPRKKHTCFIPTRRPSTSAILASPKDQDVYLKLAFQSYLSSLLGSGEGWSVTWLWFTIIYQHLCQ